MGILVFIILGGIVGWLAARLLGRDEGAIASIAIGIVGSMIGGVVSGLLTGGNQSFLALDLTGLIWSFVGAVILVAILNALSRPHRV